MKQKFIDCMMKFSHDAWGGDSIPSTEKSFAEVFDVLVKNGVIQQWQPIETAPKDGRLMLLGYFNNANKWRTLRGQFVLKNSEMFEDPNDESNCEGWYEISVECDGEDCGAWMTKPTHWQPLPTPPVTI